MPGKTLEAKTYWVDAKVLSNCLFLAGQMLACWPTDWWNIAKGSCYLFKKIHEAKNATGASFHTSQRDLKLLLHHTTTPLNQERWALTTEKGASGLFESSLCKAKIAKLFRQLAILLGLRQQTMPSAVTHWNQPCQSIPPEAHHSSKTAPDMLWLSCPILTQVEPCV